MVEGVLEGVLDVCWKVGVFEVRSERGGVCRLERRLTSRPFKGRHPIVPVVMTHNQSHTPPNA